MAKDIAMTKKNKKNSFLEWAESTDRQIYRETDDYVRSLRALYDDAIDAMDGKIYKYLSQIADEDGMSLAEAKRWLSIEERRAFQTSLEEFKRKSIAAIGDSALDKEVRQMSRRARISYLQAIQLSLKTELAKLMDAEEKRLFNHLRESYETKYYHELYGMARMTAPEPIQKVNGEAINRLIGRHWHVDGKDVSDRLSARNKNTIALLEREIGQNLAMGKSQDEVIRTVAKNMNRSFRGAATLVQTETASILTQAARDSYSRYGVEEYQLSATLDLKTSEICQEMDRKHFPIKDMKQGVNAPPFHPNCRTAIMPYFGDDLQKRMQAEVGRMARDPVTGKSVRVGDLSYKEWYNKYVESNPKARAYAKAGKNRYSDKKQYERYKSILKQNAPNRFKDFQEIKYLDDRKWERLQDNYYVKNNIQNGVFGDIINPEKQRPHNYATRVEGKSYLFKGVDAQMLFDRYAGTGEVVKNRKGRTHREICVADRVIGIDIHTGKETNMFKIHHSKSRTHIVPYSMKE